jgi:hypothetical protein
MAAKKGMKKCPSCKMWVDKNQGCDAMVCVCGCTFCWRCGEDVNKKGGCVCLQNLEHLSAGDRNTVIQVPTHDTSPAFFCRCCIVLCIPAAPHNEAV